MTHYFKASDAGSIAIHAMAFLAGNGDRLVRIKEIAGTFGVSQAHLAKVLNRLVHAGFVTASRGPMGGYRLDRPADSITLKDIFTAIDGILDDNCCMFSVPLCDSKGCVLGDFFDTQSKRIDNKLIRTKLSDVSIRPGVFPDFSET